MSAWLHSPAAETTAAWVALGCVVLYVIADKIVVALDLVDRLLHRGLEQEAADHGEPTREAVEQLVDADAWARANGYAPAWLDEQTEDWIFASPRFQDADPERAAAVLFAADVIEDINDWTGGGAA